MQIEMNYLCHRRRCRRFRWRWPTILDVAFFFHLETKFRLDGVRFISEYNQFEIDLTWVVLCIVLCYIRETWIFWSFWSFGDLVCDITNWTVDNVRLLLFFSLFFYFSCVCMCRFGFGCERKHVFVFVFCQCHE